MKTRELTFIIVALLLGAILGGFVGELIGSFLPPGAAKILFTKSLKIGFETTRVELYSISFTVGLMFKINFMSVLAVLLVIVYFRWWYI
ncbi:MAG: DUF4321 domain-containing protein [Candidatus Zixiibacteriota bacterium]|nr:MAG: DUF4321 domain-containing protein [candidate division Zixibacteria bacterium]